jgi:hypothetical protein
MKAFLAFEFHDQLPVNNEIRPEATIQLNRFIYKWHRFLAFHSKPSFLQFICQGCFVN